MFCSHLCLSVLAWSEARETRGHDWFQSNRRRNWQRRIQCGPSVELLFHSPEPQQEMSIAMPQSLAAKASVALEPALQPEEKQREREKRKKMEVFQINKLWLTVPMTEDKF